MICCNYGNCRTRDEFEGQSKAEIVQKAPVGGWYVSAAGRNTGVSDQVFGEIEF
jgi:hypothetical protein